MSGLPPTNLRPSRKPPKRSHSDMSGLRSLPQGSVTSLPMEPSAARAMAFEAVGKCRTLAEPEPRVSGRPSWHN